MAGKAGSGPQSLADALGDATQAIARALSTPEAADPKVQAGLTKLLQITSTMARGGGQAPGGGAAPGAGPGGTPPGAGPPGAGAGPPGGGAANPAMPSLTGGQLPPTPPGAGATSNVPQPSSDELRRLIAQGSG